jgi:hypothetical protein
MCLPVRYCKYEVVAISSGAQPVMAQNLYIKAGMFVQKKSKEINMKSNLRLCFIVMAAGFLCFKLIFGISAFAADQNPCFEDTAKFCKDIAPGMTALMDCLEKHESQLSSGCKAHEAKMLGLRVERAEQVGEKVKFRQACMNDMGKFCNDADPAKGGMLNCLKEHENELSAPCVDSMRVMQK